MWLEGDDFGEIASSSGLETLMRQITMPTTSGMDQIWTSKAHLRPGSVIEVVEVWVSYSGDEHWEQIPVACADSYDLSMES